MIFDADRDGFAAAGPIDADIAIIGAGAAGITLALALRDCGLRIILIDSGGVASDRTAQGLCAGSVADPDCHPPIERYRRRCFGGSTAIWGGRLVPFDPIDMAPRPWLGLPGWPLTWGELAEYYPAAVGLCEGGTFAFDARVARPGGMTPMFAGFTDADVSTDRIERFSRPTDFGRTYRRQLAAAATVTVILHATATQIDLTTNACAVRQITAISRAGVSFVIAARAFILAAGGIEVPRLMLASNGVCAGGVGNSKDQVGRCYMTHLAGTAGFFSPAPNRKPFHGYDRAPGGIYLRRRLSIQPTAQARVGSGNAIARLHHPPPADPVHGSGVLSALTLGRRLIMPEYGARLSGKGDARIGGHLTNIARAPVSTAAFLVALLAGRTLARRKTPSLILTAPNHQFTLDLHAEQQPNDLSRIRLTHTRDPSGLLGAHIDWRVTDADRRTVSQTIRLMGRALSAGGHGSLVYATESIADEIIGQGAYGGHHLGTARMSSDPAHGVVDKDCRVHGLENLFVAGGAVFATSSQANPTLTIVALTLRLADHLKKNLSSGPTALAAGGYALHQSPVPAHAHR